MIIRQNNIAHSLSEVCSGPTQVSHTLFYFLILFLGFFPISLQLKILLNHKIIQYQSKMIAGVIMVTILAIYSFFNIEEVKQGYVGIYKELGVLNKKLANPGFHFVGFPFRELLHLSVSVQTDIVSDIPCGTADGTLISFKKIQVVNKLKKKHVYETVKNYTQQYEKIWISDKIHHQINQFCSRHTLQEIYISIFDQLDQQLMKSLKKDLKLWAPGIQIVSIRITKPKIPLKIRKNFELMERTKIEFNIEEEREKVLIEEEMTTQKKKIVKAQSKYEVKMVRFDKALKLKQNQLKMAKIQSQMILQKGKAEADVQFQGLFQEAQLLPLLHTEEYLSFLFKDSLTSNSTLTIGERIPNIYLS